MIHRRKLPFVALCLSIAILMVSAIVYQAHRRAQAHDRAAVRVRLLLTVSDPERFARELSSEQERPAAGKLETRCRRGQLVCYETVTPSPFFPHAELDYHQIVPEHCYFVSEAGRELDLSTEGRFLLVDPYWQVFWVGVRTCRYGSETFGPYRSLRWGD